MSVKSRWRLFRPAGGVRRGAGVWSDHHANGRLRGTGAGSGAPFDRQLCTAARWRDEMVVSRGTPTPARMKPSKPWGWRSRRCPRTWISCARSTQRGKAATAIGRVGATRDRVHDRGRARARHLARARRMAESWRSALNAWRTTASKPSSTANWTTGGSSCSNASSGAARRAGWRLTRRGRTVQPSFRCSRRQDDPARRLQRPRPRVCRPRPGGVGDVAGERGVSPSAR